jgi:outer membrane protein assembly factor BamD
MKHCFRHFAVALVVAAAFTLAACGGGKATKIASEEAREGRDRALLEEGITMLQKNRYTQARLLFNTLINTYPDSPLLPVTKLALADSYYREGSFSSMNESEVEYRDWLQFFPKHGLADDVMMKIAEVHMRQVQAADRDTTHAKLAERQLLKLVEQYPETELKKRAEDQLWEVREILGMHELKVARFYFTHRQAYKAAASRTQEIVEKYPGFSRTDEALYLLGVSMFEQEDTEQAIEHFTRLCRLYPQSAYYEDAANYLRRLDAEVPEAAPGDEQPKARGTTPGFFGNIMENYLSRPRLENISKDGVLFKKDDTPAEALERALSFSVAQPGDATPKSTTTVVNQK